MSRITVKTVTDESEKMDYTKLRLSTKNRIVLCSKCKRKGMLKKYVDGSSIIIHKSHIELGLFNHIDESCYFKNEVKS